MSSPIELGKLSNKPKIVTLPFKKIKNKYYLQPDFTSETENFDCFHNGNEIYLNKNQTLNYGIVQYQSYIDNKDDDVSNFKCLKTLKKSILDQNKLYKFYKKQGYPLFDCIDSSNVYTVIKINALGQTSETVLEFFNKNIDSSTFPKKEAIKLLKENHCIIVKTSSLKEVLPDLQNNKNEIQEKNIMEKSDSLEKKEPRPSLGELLKNDLKVGAYRAAGDQVTNIGRAALLKALESSTNEQAQALRNLLDSKLGEALVAMGVGITLTVAPGVSDDERAQKLAEQLRQKGVAEGINMLLDIFTSACLPAFQSIINTLPADEPESKKEEIIEEKEVIVLDKKM